MNTRDLAAEIDELAKRIKAIEGEAKRLNAVILDDVLHTLGDMKEVAAIERAATCGTGPNEPGVSSPAQADVGEASARAIQQEAIVEAAMERYKKLHGGPQKEDAADAIAAHFTALFKKGA